MVGVKNNITNNGYRTQGHECCLKVGGLLVRLGRGRWDCREIGRIGGRIVMLE